MPYLKPIKGHTKIAGKKSVYTYLTKAGRALDVDLINCSDCSLSGGLNWAEQMDRTRLKAGNDEPYRGIPARTYNHYVLSPDPKDNISLEEFRDFMVSFLHEAFEDLFQIAVVYHDDNESHILHAHFIVNNTNLLTGGRLAPWLTNERVKGIKKLCEKMAQERGWSNFLEADEMELRQAELEALGISDEHESSTHKLKGIDMGNAKRSKLCPFSTEQADYLGKTEREIASEGGYSWKDDLRQRIRIAKTLSYDERDFVTLLKAMDVAVSVTRRGDYLYGLADDQRRCVRGYRLGKSYSRTDIRKVLSKRDGRHIDKPTSMERAALMERLDAFRIVGIRTIGYVEPGSKVTLKDVADSLETHMRFGIKDRLSCAHAMEKASHEEKEKIEHAVYVMEALGRAERPTAARKATQLQGERSVFEDVDVEELWKNLRDRSMSSGGHERFVRRSVLDPQTTSSSVQLKSQKRTTRADKRDRAQKQKGSEEV